MSMLAWVGGGGISVVKVCCPLGLPRLSWGIMLSWSCSMWPLLGIPVPRVDCCCCVFGCEGLGLHSRSLGVRSWRRAFSMWITREAGPSLPCFHPCSFWDTTKGNGNCRSYMGLTMLLSCKVPKLALCFTKCNGHVLRQGLKFRLSLQGDGGVGLFSPLWLGASSSVLKMMLSLIM